MHFRFLAKFFVLAWAVRFAVAARVRYGSHSQQDSTKLSRETKPLLVSCHPKKSSTLIGIGAGVVSGCVLAAICGYLCFPKKDLAGWETIGEGTVPPSSDYPSWTCRKITCFMLSIVIPVVVCACVGGLIGFIVGSHTFRSVPFSCALGYEPPELGKDCSSEVISSAQCLQTLGFCPAFTRSGAQVDAAVLGETKKVSCNDESIENFVTCKPDGSFSPVPQCSFQQATPTAPGTGAATATTTTTSATTATATTAIYTNGNTDGTNTQTTTTTIDTERITSTTTAMSTVTTTSTSTTTVTVDVTKIANERGRMAFDFDGSVIGNEYLKLDAGDEVFVHSVDQDGWAVGQVRRKEGAWPKGFFPINHWQAEADERIMTTTTTTGMGARAAGAPFRGRGTVIQEFKGKDLYGPGFLDLSVGDKVYVQSVDEQGTATGKVIKSDGAWPKGLFPVSYCEPKHWS